MSLELMESIKDTDKQKYLNYLLEVFEELPNNWVEVCDEVFFLDKVTDHPYYADKKGKLNPIYAKFGIYETYDDLKAVHFIDEDMNKDLVILSVFQSDGRFDLLHEIGHSVYWKGLSTKDRIKFNEIFEKEKIKLLENNQIYEYLDAKELFAERFAKYYLGKMGDYYKKAYLGSLPLIDQYFEEVMPKYE